MGTTLVAGFESTYLPAYGVDSLDVTDHARLWRQDLDDVRAAGVRHLRYPLRWQQIEREPGRFDWSHTDQVLNHLRDNGFVPIVDLVHHTTYPDWLQDGFRGPDFGPAMERYAEAVAVRYPWLPAYTLFNEPFATLFLAGHEGLWPPYDRGMPGFVRLLSSVLPALSASARCWRELLPDAHHVWVDTAEHHAGTGAQADYVRLANDRRHVALDLAIGHDLDPGTRPFLRQLVEAGGEHLLSLQPLQVDVLGLDYYCHSEWLYDDDGAHAPSPEPIGFAEVAQQYADRYGLPMMMSETNVRGLPTDQVTWLRYALEEYELAVERGLPMHGLCWFPQVDSADWDSLLARCAGRFDPVGVRALRQDGTRVRTELTAAWEAVAAGATSADLPAYRLQSPCDSQLASVVERLAHWPWQDPAGSQVVAPTVVSAPPASPVAECDEPDLVVVSHLRWPWVWQRPHHLVARLAAARAGSGARTFYAEEPVIGPVTVPELRSEELDGVTRVWL
ncbi:MAG TPA: family 1 glycosylhydrolase, partial [Actinomycetales bacterium]